MPRLLVAKNLAKNLLSSAEQPLHPTRHERRQHLILYVDHHAEIQYYSRHADCQG
jgi:hypothetical protein